MRETKSTYSHFSIERFDSSLDHWRVPHEWKEPIRNYLLYGFSPGGFFTSLLANDMMTAVARSHPSNDIPALKTICGWITNQHYRKSFYGSYEIVESWLQMTPTARRQILENAGLVYTEREEFDLTLRS